MRNPYKNVNWGTHRQVKSLSHTHITNQSVFDKAVALGYEHIPVTDYAPSKPRYPLGDHFTNIPSGVLGSPNSEKVNTVDSYHYNALGSFAEGHGHGVETPKIEYQDLFNEIFAGLQYQDGGGVTINHPVYRNLAQCCERLDFDDRVLGIEIYNSYYELDGTTNPNRHYGFYKKMLTFWDEILSTGRRCFGFFVIDWMDVSVNYGSNILIVPEYTEHECLKAYRNGNFYGIIKDTGLRFYTLEMINGDRELSASVNKEATINVYTSKGLVKSITGREVAYTIDPSDIFVRVEAIDTTDDDGRIYSNPIMLDPKSDDWHEKRKRFLLLHGEIE